MSTILAYERDPRLTHLETEVVDVGEEDGRPFVVLADTVLFPEGGGQPSDRGTVGGVAVVDVRSVGGVVRHFLGGPPPSGAVRVALDWARRFDHMQQHTAQHLLTAVADRRFGSPTTAFHLGEHTSDIELDTPALDAERMGELEEAVAVQIRAARRVTTRRVSPEEYASLDVRSRGLPEGHEGDVRLVEIEGIDLNTCGGTHCGSTAELEALKLLGTESMRGGTRLVWVAGGRLRRLLGVHTTRAADLRALLGTSDDELVSRMEAKLAQLKHAERNVRTLREELADASVSSLAAKSDRVIAAHWPDHDLPFLQRVGRGVVERVPDRVVFLTAGSGEEGAFLLTAGEEAGVDLAEAGRGVADLLEGRGGGSGRVFQGKAARLSRRDEAQSLVRYALLPHPSSGTARRRSSTSAPEHP